jgi:hypothetical protein
VTARHAGWAVANVGIIAAISTVCSVTALRQREPQRIRRDMSSRTVIEPEIDEDTEDSIEDMAEDIMDVLLCDSDPRNRAGDELA